MATINFYSKEQIDDLMDGVIAPSQAQLDAMNSGITAAKVSTYDGYAKNVSKGKPCHFVLDYSNEEEAINAYSNMRNGTFLHKAIMILEKLEEQSAALFNKNKNVDPESTIVIDTWLDKVLRFLFEQY